MKQLYLIRHAKSSWDNPDLDDFSRPLNKRGKEDCRTMAERLSQAGVRPDLIVASPAKRTKKTAVCMAKETGYDKKSIRFYDQLYLGSMGYHLQLISELMRKVDVLFVVGHNNTITEIAEYLTGSSLGNVPTCGIVAVEYAGQDGFTAQPGAVKLLFFDYPKKQPGAETGQ